MRKAALIIVSVCMVFALMASGCAQNAQPTSSGKVTSTVSSLSSSVTEGRDTYRGFVIDNVLHSDENGDIHYNVYVPESYDGGLFSKDPQIMGWLFNR